MTPFRTRPGSASIPGVACTLLCSSRPASGAIHRAADDLDQHLRCSVDDDGQATLWSTRGRRAGLQSDRRRARSTSGRTLPTSPGSSRTHAHRTTIGGLARRAAAPARRAAVHERHADYVREGKGPVRRPSTLGGRLIRREPAGGADRGRRAACRRLSVLDVAGGLLVLHTPGHRAGHMVAAARAVRRADHRRRDLATCAAAMTWPRPMLCTDAGAEPARPPRSSVTLDVRRRRVHARAGDPRRRARAGARRSCADAAAVTPMTRRASPGGSRRQRRTAAAGSGC